MTTVPDPSQPGSASSAPATSNYRAGRRDLVLGVVIGVAISVAILLPAALEAVNGSVILSPLPVYGYAVVLVLLAVVVAIWAVVDGVPAWRGRTTVRLSGGRPMNLRAITATRPRAMLLGMAVGLLLGLGAAGVVVGGLELDFLPGA